MVHLSRLWLLRMSIYFSLCVFACVYTCSWFACVCTHVKARCSHQCLLLLSTLLSWYKLSHLTQSSPVSLDQYPVSSLKPPASALFNHPQDCLGLQKSTAMSNSDTTAGDFNSGCHASTLSTLPTVLLVGLSTKQ